MKLCEADALSLTALPATIAPISLNPGYTWLGYLPQECLPVNEALTNLDPQPTSNDRLIGQSSFAVYSGNQWIGSLTTLCPGGGYVIKLVNGSTLTYPNASTNGTKTHLEAQLNSPTGEYAVANLQHSMTVIAGVKLPSGQFSMDTEDRLYAFVNGQCVGMTSPDQENTNYYFLSIGENSDEPQEVSFKVWINKEEQLYHANETLDFAPLKGVGLVDEPFVISLGEKADAFSETVIGQPYPNPFKEETLLPVTLIEDATVKVYLFDNRGLSMLRPIEFKGVEGFNEFVITSENLPQGIFQLVVEVVGVKEQLRKVQLIVHLE